MIPKQSKRFNYVYEILKEVCMSRNTSQIRTNIICLANALEKLITTYFATQFNNFIYLRVYNFEVNYYQKVMANEC